MEVIYVSLVIPLKSVIHPTPQLNPIEIQWRVLKEMLAGKYFESTDGLVGAITDLIDSGQMRPVRLMKYLAH